MPEPLTCAGLAAAVVAQPVPVMFLDTAAVLDVFRVPFRHELHPDIIESAVAAVNEAASEPRSLWLLTTANVVQEIGGHRERVRQELVAHVESLNSSVHRFLSVAKRVFPERRFSWPELAEIRLDQRILQIVDRLIDSAVIFRGTAECASRARTRVWEATPPASRGNQQFKDCEIFEEFLELI